MTYTTQQIEATKAYRDELRAEQRELLKIKQIHTQPEQFARLQELGNLVTHWDFVVSKVLGGTQYKRYERDMKITLQPLNA